MFPFDLWLGRLPLKILRASKRLQKPVLSLVFIMEKNLKQEILIKTTMEAVTYAIEDVHNKAKEN